MKKIYFSLFFFLVLCLPINRCQAESTIQSRIDAAAPYETIQLENRTYNERIQISKPITIKGNTNTKIVSCGTDPVITIKKEYISIQNLEIEQCNDRADQPAVLVTGDNHSINEVEVHASYIGMKLENARNIKIENSIIVGQKKGNGIDLWQSDNNFIKNTKIQQARDGLYVEKSNHNIVKSNRIQQSRYGIHLMYSDKTVIENNISKENTTGAMIMGVKDTFIAGNQFINNNKNVHAQGLLLYDAVKTKVMQNEIVNNRVGMYVEKASDNTIMNNIISNNFIGLQFKEASANKFTQNEITGNVNESQATHSRENHIYKNYWDASLKVDVDGSGTSDIPYKADAYFLLLTQDTPDYQLFFQSPGMRILQNFIRIPDQSVLLDKEPHMIPKIVAQKGEKRGFQSNVWISSISMLLLGSALFILGRKN